ncbi:MAG TPA: DUF4242 domain-containing protein [Candidatus Thermoplasmatota archaeon]|nr:DUF4242 domain-containing protein [Candidatus Thermoplasmatota archaeon]
MPLYMDVHENVRGLTPEKIAEAHKRDLEKQGQYDVHYHKYWFNEKEGRVFCLVEAPSKEAAERVHREANGMVADRIYEIKEGL